MRAVKVALSTAALAATMAASSQSSTLRDERSNERTPIAASQRVPNQSAQPQWYQDPIAITLGLLALFAIGDIAVLFASNNQRGQRRALRRTTAQPIA
ncbi:MAG: hypothetical protein AB1762_12230 [Gemmatimonadota bacterium]